MTSSLVGLLAPDWVDYSIATAIFTLILLPALFWIPPSIPHLFQTGKSSEAMEALEKMTKILDVKIPLDFKTKYSKNNFNVEAKKDQNRHNVLDLLRHARPRRMVLMTTSIFICTVMVLYGLAYNAAGLPGNLYVNNSMNGIGHLVAAAFWILLVPHFGRRTLMAASLFIMPLCCFLRRKKIDFGQNFFFILFFLATKGNLYRGVRKSWSQVPKMTSSRDINDFRLKIVKK